jgi:hypothetical protein
MSAVPTGRLCVKIDIGAVIKICQENPNVFKSGERYRALYMKT